MHDLYYSTYLPRALEILRRVKSCVSNISAAKVACLQEHVLASRMATNRPEDLRGVCSSLELLLKHFFSGRVPRDAVQASVSRNINSLPGLVVARLRFVKM